ncbi:Arc family DNA-binding protein [Cohaesibacter marisflavi]
MRKELKIEAAINERSLNSEIIYRLKKSLEQAVS